MKKYPLESGAAPSARATPPRWRSHNSRSGGKPGTIRYNGTQSCRGDWWKRSPGARQGKRRTSVKWPPRTKQLRTPAPPWPAPRYRPHVSVPRAISGEPIGCAPTPVGVWPDRAASAQGARFATLPAQPPFGRASGVPRRKMLSSPFVLASPSSRHRTKHKDSKHAGARPVSYGVILLATVSCNVIRAAKKEKIADGSSSACGVHKFFAAQDRKSRADLAPQLRPTARSLCAWRKSLF